MCGTSGLWLHSEIALRRQTVAWLQLQLTRHLNFTPSLSFHASVKLRLQPVPEKKNGRGPETSPKVLLTAALFGLQPGVENLEAPQSQRMVPNKQINSKFEMNPFLAGVCVNQTCQVPAQRPTRRKFANMTKCKSMQNFGVNQAKVHSETQSQRQTSQVLALLGRVLLFGEMSVACPSSGNVVKVCALPTSH